jgi:calcineurin-like phosphoesterase family protein
MGNVYFISDLHFNHENMAIKRGFNNAQEMNDHIIKCWNSVVNKKDTVWILGDITMEKTQGYELLDKLKGFKKVVLGNHDKPQHVPELLKYVNSVSGMVKYKGNILTHCPIHESEIGRFNKNVHGHVHENSIMIISLKCDLFGNLIKNTKIDDKYLNVSCEAINYIPIRL